MCSGRSTGASPAPGGLGHNQLQVGSAQSLGCVEMPYGEASQVYRYTPIGTLINVT